MLSAVILSGHSELKLMELASMSIATDHQRKGFGSSLVETGFERCRQLSYTAVVVLTHPLY